MIKAAKQTTVIFIDHAANTSIAKQTTLSSSNTDKLNLRLVRASTYLSQFKLNVKYRPGKDHVIPDALSRLSSGNGPATRRRTSPADALDMDTYFCGVLDPSDDPDCYAFQGSLIGMSDDFRKQITDDYARERMWSKLLAMLKKLAQRAVLEQNTPVTIDTIDADQPATADPEGGHPVATEEDSSVTEESSEEERIPKKFRAGIDFELVDGLIYYIDEGARRLCLPSAVEAEVFRLAHDDNAHADIHRCFNRKADTYYVPRLSKKIRRYIGHCPNCQLTQTKRHRLYGELMPISSPSHPFHIVAMDFIVALLEELNAMLIVTDKFFKRIVFIVDKTTYSASQWGNALLDRLLLAD